MQINLAFFVSFLVLALRGTIFLALRVRLFGRQIDEVKLFTAFLKACTIVIQPASHAGQWTKEEYAVFPIRQAWRMQKRKHRTKEDAAQTYRAGNEEDERGRDAASSSDAEDEEGEDKVGKFSMLLYFLSGKRICIVAS